MPKTSWMFLFLLVFSVYAEDQDLPVVASAKELKGVKAKKIIWEKDGAKMVHIPANPSGTRKSEPVYDEFGDLVKPAKIIGAADAFLWMPMGLLWASLRSSLSRRVINLMRPLTGIKFISIHRLTSTQ